MARPGREKPNDDSTVDDGKIELHGAVDEALPNAMFRVTCDNGLKVLATVSGKIRKHRIRVLPGDGVRVEVSPYDPSRGRITFRDRT